LQFDLRRQRVPVGKAKLPGDKLKAVAVGEINPSFA
jgi:hypothetical protein